MVGACPSSRKAPLGRHCILRTPSRQVGSRAGGISAHPVMQAGAERSRQVRVLIGSTTGTGLNAPSTLTAPSRTPLPLQYGVRQSLSEYSSPPQRSASVGGIERRCAKEDRERGEGEPHPKTEGDGTSIRLRKFKTGRGAFTALRGDPRDPTHRDYSAWRENRVARRHDHARVLGAGLLQGEVVRQELAPRIQHR